MPTNPESSWVQFRALACALLQVALLAIHPVAALAARAARTRVTRQNGAPAELVFAGIERVTIEAGAVHRYVYEWDIGPTSDLLTPDRAMAMMKAAPNLVFPFDVSGGTGIALNQVYDLDNVRWPRDNGNPVLVNHEDSTSFSFLTLPGHFRGPGRTIQFTILGRRGRLILRHVGGTSTRISDLAYDGGAWFSWRSQAATLRTAISVAAHGPD